MIKSRNSKGMFICIEVEKKQLIEIFERKLCLIKRDINECWNWKWEKNKYKYGLCRLRRKLGGLFYTAHRLSYEYHNNLTLTHKEKVCHKCDNPSCINPHHLFIGTDKDNSDDKVKKNRQSKGEGHSKIMKEKSAKGDNHVFAKLKSEQVMNIIQLKAKGLTYKKIADIYKVDHSCIYKIVRGKRWQHLTTGDV